MFWILKGENVRIAFITHGFSPFSSGGVPLYMGNLAARLATRSEIEQIRVFTACDARSRILHEKIEVIPITFSAKLLKVHAFGKVAYEKMRATYDSPPDIIHSAIRQGWKALDYGCPMLATFFDALPRFRSMLEHYNYSIPRRIKESAFLRAREHFEEEFCNRVHHIVTISESIRQDIHGYYGTPLSKISTILGTGIDTKIFKPSLDAGEKVREKLPSSDYVVLTVTNFEPIKGVHFLVNAMKDIVEEFPQTHFLFVGDGTQRKTLQSMVSKQRLEKNATFTGHVDYASLPAYYNASDVFVRPSLWEGLGYVFLESLACGTPVVGTMVGGIPEVVLASCGVLVPPADSKLLADAINNLLGDSNLRKKMADAGPPYIRKHFTWDIIANNYFEVYENMLNEF